MRTGNVVLVFVASAGGIVAACKASTGPGSCSGPVVLSVLPVPVSAVSFVTPIGSMGPPVHTIPTDHAYVYLTGTGITLVAPAKFTVTTVTRVRYLVSPFRQGVTDYAVTASLCGGYQLLLGHVETVVSKVANAAGTNCQTYSTANETVESCSNSNAAVPFEAGETIGTVGVPSIGAFDFGPYDTHGDNYFVNAARYRSPCTSSYRFPSSGSQCNSLSVHRAACAAMRMG